MFAIRSVEMLSSEIFFSKNSRNLAFSSSIGPASIADSSVVPPRLYKVLQSGTLKHSFQLSWKRRTAEMYERFLKHCGFPFLLSISASLPAKQMLSHETSRLSLNYLFLKFLLFFDQAIISCSHLIMSTMV